MAVLGRSSLRLALMSAMQLLPPRQRAVLILRDVLDWSAAEVAELLETTTAAVNSALQRARARLAAEGVLEEDVAEPSSADQRALLDRYVKAFEAADLEALRRLLTDDVVMEMPPYLLWYRGREGYLGFMAWFFRTVDTDRIMVPTVANGQPAAVAYVREPEGDGFAAHTIHVFEAVRVGGETLFRRNTVYGMPGMFPAFGFPERVAGPGGL